MIYCNKKEDVEALSQAMNEQDFVTAYIHGGMEQAERDKIMYAFRTASVRVLISTDLLARGIDVQ
jgi:translation initiation factor 4A